MLMYMTQCVLKLTQPCMIFSIMHATIVVCNCKPLRIPRKIEQVNF